MGTRTLAQPLLLCARGYAPLGRSWGVALPTSWGCLSTHGDLGPTPACPSLPLAATQLRGFHVSTASHAQQATNVDATAILGLMFSPTQMGVQALEWSHATSGLPWWASIPAAAIATKLSLLPLSMKAKQASAHFQFFDAAVAEAKALTVDMSASDRRALGSSALAKAIYRHTARKAGLPSIWWYWGNAAVQATALLSFTSALNNMATAVWTGFTTEGPPGLTDLSSPPVFLSTLSTPFGTMGAVVPLLCVLAYSKAVDASPLASVPGIAVAFRMMAVPFYCLTLIQPHATLLYWLTHTLSCWAVQAYIRSPAQVKDLDDTSPGARVETALRDADMLLAVAKQYSVQKKSKDAATAAVLLYEKAVQRLEQVEQESDDDEGVQEGVAAAGDSVAGGAGSRDMAGQVDREAVLEQAKEALEEAKQRKAEFEAK